MTGAEDLGVIARRLAKKPTGILAMDESHNTIGKRLGGVGLENTEPIRKAYREMLVTTPRLGGYISGAILFEETLGQRTTDGVPFVDVLKGQDIIPGIKVDKGLVYHPNFPSEQITEGLDGLEQRLRAYSGQGVLFSKFRVVLTIGNDTPSQNMVQENARRLALYAAISQALGIVPIVEPEVLMDGEHGIDQCEIVTKYVLGEVFHRLQESGVYLRGMVLKPNMVVPGSKNPNKVEPQEIAYRTVQVLKDTVPASVPGIAFLSGGLSDEDATLYLSLMNEFYGSQVPWNLTFSFGRGLQRAALNVYADGQPDNVARAQAVLLERARQTSLATIGQYKTS